MARSFHQNSRRQSKKITERKFSKKHEPQEQEIGLNTLLEFMFRLYPNNEQAHQEFLSPKKSSDGRYITSEATLDKFIDPKIFLETQLKRFIRWLTTTPPLLRFFFTWIFIKKAKMKLAYFDQQENLSPEKMFKHELQFHTTEAESHQFIIHNLGHAAQLIQTSGMNILTDPVFGNLAPIIYPSTTQNFRKNFQTQNLPHIDVILISHNHRDHVDVNTLKQFIKKAQNEDRSLPQLLVPKGDEDFFKKLGFTDVRAFEWHEQITLYSKTNEPVTFCSTPADHRSGRNGYDSHQSLVIGWTISPKNRDEILYFSGDTCPFGKAV